MPNTHFLNLIALHYMICVVCVHVFFIAPSVLSLSFLFLAVTYLRRGIFAMGSAKCRENRWLTVIKSLNLINSYMALISFKR